MADASKSPTPAKPSAAESATCLPFERSILALERKIDELKTIPDVDLNGELQPLERRRDRLLEEVFGKLSAWQKVQVARHPRAAAVPRLRPGMCDDWIELHGDRLFGEDQAISDRASPASATTASCWWVTARAARRARSSPATSAARTPRATARRWRRCAWPSASVCRSSR